MPNNSHNKEQSVEDTPNELPNREKFESPTGSPPSVSMSNLMVLESCVSNLGLAHEIVVNSDLGFKPQNPAKDSLEERVTQIVHRAFWDILKEQLCKTPPNYSHAIVLLQEVKTMLQDFLPPCHVSLRTQLDGVIDLQLIQQEVEHGALDLHRLAAYIVDTMAALCAPVRDAEIRALKHITEPVELFREIFRVLGLMKTDMVNFTVQTLRPLLRQQAVQYERAKFQQILEKQPDFLDNTTAWLQRAALEEALVIKPLCVDETPRPESGSPLSPAAVLNRAYMRLLCWDPQELKYPETVVMDRVRLNTLGQRLRLLILEASVLLLTSTQCGGVLYSLHGFVGKLKKTITALLEGSHTRETDLKEALLGLGEQLVVQVTEALTSHGGMPLSQESQDLLKGQIVNLWMKDNLICTLIGDRVESFLQAMLKAGPDKRAPEPPASLRLLSTELSELGTSFRQIIHFNRTVFGPFYGPILRKLLFSPGQVDTGVGSR